MKNHETEVQGCRLNLKIWRDYIKSLSDNDLESAKNFFIGAVCAGISTEDMKTHLAIVQEIFLTNDFDQGGKDDYREKDC